MNNINESVLDPIQKNRCDALFNINDKSDKPVILASTKQFIFSLLDKFKEETGLKDMEYLEVFLVGSSLGYQYRDDCDIDVDVRVNYTSDELSGMFHFIPKNILLPGTAHPVNVFLLTKNDPPFDFEHNAENAYDLLTDTWIKQGRLANADNIPFEYLSGISEFIMDGMSLELNRAERDLYDLIKYINIDPNKVSISEKELKEAISNKITQLIIDKDALNLAHHIMFRMDQDGFDENPKPIKISIKYEYESKHYSMNNLIYKYIDRYGYYDKINKMIKDIDAQIELGKEKLKETVEDSPETRNQLAAQTEVINNAKSTKIDLDKTKEQKIEKDDKDQENVSEAYMASTLTNIEIGKILLENGYEASNENIKNVRDNYMIVPLNEGWFNKKRTEYFMNRTIAKASGKTGIAIFNGLGFLFGGIGGLILASAMTRDSSDIKNEKIKELYNYVINDSECSDLIDEIRTEVNLDNPDKAKLKELKDKFVKAVKRCKTEMKEENNEYNAGEKPHISL